MNDVEDLQGQLAIARALFTLGVPGYDATKIKDLQDKVNRLLDEQAGEILEEMEILNRNFTPLVGMNRPGKTLANPNTEALCNQSDESRQNHADGPIPLRDAEAEWRYRCEVCGNLLDRQEHGRCSQHR